MCSLASNCFRVALCCPHWPHHPHHAHHRSINRHAAEAQANAESLSKQLAAAESAVAQRQAELKEARSQLQAWQDKVRGGRVHMR